MASIQQAPVQSKSRNYQRTLKVDMTPMVDLGFLLVTFFVFTSTMSTSATTALVMPKDGPPTNTAAATTLTLLAGGHNQVYGYGGIWEDAVHANAVQPSSYSIAAGAGALIRQQQKALEQNGHKKEELVLLIKPSEQSSYKNLVDLLDEVMINGVTRYAIVAPDPAETAFMDAH
ncbi:Biopolymer transport protein ExbD/TolR [Cnuella takakiae]|uniref:Biopolymer transport protein ExbD/TolR n=1 Tax=Cnuella takakiae TaxID=1302690 RepID=A0A1M5F7Z9_9BACT|nr:biopolymer transporter ExbD [Cnuella takakiae]OLY91005.1 hypothetical protein BUE76_03145 [Cnuella takakiae]SHF87606.1 Biopolymer transport protein ExbD/TolR [Cnuella takakiae]